MKVVLFDLKILKRWYNILFDFFELLVLLFDFEIDEFMELEKFLRIFVEELVK